MPEKLVTYLFDMNDKGNIIDQRPPFLPMLIGTGCGSGFGLGDRARQAASWLL